MKKEFWRWKWKSNGLVTNNLFIFQIYKTEDRRQKTEDVRFTGIYFSVAVTYNCVYIYYFYSLRSWFGCQTSHRRFQTSNTSTIFPNKFASSIERLLLSRRDCLNRHAFTWFISILIGFQKNCRCTSEGRDLAPRCVKTHTDNSSNPNHKTWRSPAAPPTRCLKVRA